MKNLFEYNEYSEHMKQYTTISDEELMEMANMTTPTTGIDDVVIWVGPNPTSHGKRIKISNTPNKFSKDDCFTLTIPEFKTIGNINTKLITKKVMKQIIDFVILNKDVIYELSDEKIFTDEFFKKVKPIK